MYYAQIDTEHKYGWDLSDPTGPPTPPGRRYKSTWNDLKTIKARENRVLHHAEYMMQQEIIDNKSNDTAGNHYGDKFARIERLLEGATKAGAMAHRSIMDLGRKHDKLADMVWNLSNGANDGMYPAQEKNEEDGTHLMSLEDINVMLWTIGQLTIENTSAIGNIDNKAKQAEFNIQREIEDMKRTQAQIQTALLRIQNKLEKRPAMM